MWDVFVDINPVLVVVGDGGMSVLRKQIHRSSFMDHKENDDYFFLQSILMFHQFQGGALLLWLCYSNHIHILFICW